MCTEVLIHSTPEVSAPDSMPVYTAGGVSAFLTTPLDVAKTRIMLAEVSKPAWYYCTALAIMMLYICSIYGAVMCMVKLVWCNVNAVEAHCYVNVNESK